MNEQVSSLPGVDVLRLCDVWWLDSCICNTPSLSDEEVVWGWVENPYWQLFCGETWFQHNPPIGPSSLTRWQQRIGAGHMEWLLAQTIRTLLLPAPLALASDALRSTSPCP
jgi:hypothetical protein